MNDSNQNSGASPDDSTKSPRVSPIFVGFIILVFVVTAANIYYGFVLLNRDKEPQAISAENMPGRPVPDFNLVERSGEPMGLSDFSGSVWVASFFFTTCPGPCLTLTAKMKELQGRTDDLPGLKLVSFSIDPEVDTPEVLTNYADVWEAEPGRWFFLTGDKEAIHELSMSGFLMPLEEAEDADSSEYGKYIHSTRMAVVDRTGMIRGIYDVGEPGGLEALEAKARELSR